MQCRKTLSYNLKSLRKSIGVTQEEMAATSGISYRLYQSLEAGRGNPTLFSLESIARAAQMAVSELVRLRSMRTALSSDEFLRVFAQAFQDSRLGAGIRDPNGVVLWANRKASELHGRDYGRGPVDLLKVLPAPARDVLKFQLECERREAVHPYINIAEPSAGDRRFLRYFPTSICPLRGSAPYFSAVYLTDAAGDTQANYYEFCDMLLRCVNEAAAEPPERKPRAQEL